jgi:hypothetical protein
MKPIPLGSFVPPVTGVNGSLVPVANAYDTNGVFQQRGRTNSVKRRRPDEEIDVVYDLSESYPPLTAPQRPKLDTEKVKRLMVAAAAAAAGDLRKVKDNEEEMENMDPKSKVIINLSLALFDAVEAVVEAGIIPLSGNVAGGRDAAGSGTGMGGTKVPPIPPPKPAAPAGVKELREGLEKADRESVLFDADLGTVTLANRKALANAFTNGIRSAVVAGARAANEDPVEAVRVMDDALSIVNDMDFIGASSKPFVGRSQGDMRNNKFCTMPIKFKFDDRDSRIHFETTVRKYCNLKASMSLPKPIREEQAAFLKAVRPRYPDEIVTIRVDTVSMSLQAFRKADGEKKWRQCPESVALRPDTLLPGYKSRSNFDLPLAVQEAEPGAEQGESGAVCIPAENVQMDF